MQTLSPLVTVSYVPDTDFPPRPSRPGSFLHSGARTYKGRPYPSYFFDSSPFGSKSFLQTVLFSSACGAILINSAGGSSFARGTLVLSSSWCSQNCLLTSVSHFLAGACFSFRSSVDRVCFWIFYYSLFLLFFLPWGVGQ